MEAQQCVKLTSTNGPCGLTAFSAQGRLPMIRTSAATAAGDTDVSTPRNSLLDLAAGRPQDDRARTSTKVFPVVKARGPYPIPSRTRSSSLSAPMVLHGSLCGRVGRRRKFFLKSRLFGGVMGQPPNWLTWGARCCIFSSPSTRRNTVRFFENLVEMMFVKASARLSRRNRESACKRR